MQFVFAVTIGAYSLGCRPFSEEKQEGGRDSFWSVIVWVWSDKNGSSDEDGGFAVQGLRCWFRIWWVEDKPWVRVSAAFRLVVKVGLLKD